MCTGAVRLLGLHCKLPFQGHLQFLVNDCFSCWKFSYVQKTQKIFCHFFDKYITLHLLNGEDLKPRTVSFVIFCYIYYTILLEYCKKGFQLTWDFFSDDSLITWTMLWNHLDHFYQGKKCLDFSCPPASPYIDYRASQQQRLIFLTTVAINYA